MGSMDDEKLESLAREALVREATRGSERSSTMGPKGWLKCPVPPANKRFLHNTLVGSLHSDRLVRQSKGPKHVEKLKRRSPSNSDPNKHSQDHGVVSSKRSADDGKRKCGLSLHKRLKKDLEHELMHGSTRLNCHGSKTARSRVVADSNKKVERCSEEKRDPTSYEVP